MGLLNLFNRKKKRHNNLLLEEYKQGRVLQVDNGQDNKEIFKITDVNDEEEAIAREEMIKKIEEENKKAMEEALKKLEEENNKRKEELLKKLEDDRNKQRIEEDY